MILIRDIFGVIGWRIGRVFRRMFAPVLGRAAARLLLPVLIEDMDRNGPISRALEAHYRRPLSRWPDGKGRH